MIELFFDCSSPWTYLAFTNLQAVAKSFGEEIVYRPILVGGIFNAMNPSVDFARKNPIKAKIEYSRKDLQDWAKDARIKIIQEPRVRPVNSVKVMRGCLWLSKTTSPAPFAAACFEAYWSHDMDISQDHVIAGICEGLGIDTKAFFEAISSPAIKDELRANSEELIARGGFGSPTMFLNGSEMFFGNDRIPMLVAALRSARAQ